MGVAKHRDKRQATTMILTTARRPWTNALLIGTISLVVTGCLYTEKIQPLNKVPQAIIGLRTDQDLVFVGERVILSAESSHDPENKDLTYEWSLEYEVGLEDPYKECGPQANADSCNGGTTENCCFIPLAKTNYTISLRVYDRDGLRSELVQKEVFVNNRPPSAEITTETPSNDQSHYTVGQEIWLHGFRSGDPDEGDALSYAWDAERPPASQSGVFVFEPSNTSYEPTDDPLARQRCLVIPDVSGSYLISLTVDDGELSHTDERHLEVDPDAPPCISDTSPGDATKNDFLVFDLTQPHRLEVLRVEDDLDAYPPEGGIHFDWTISEDAGATFRPVGGHHEPYLDLFPDDFTPGQVVWVRVEAQDRKERELNCGEVELRCSLVPNCPQWVTWILEFR